jgi:hypothetical protein
VEQFDRFIEGGRVWCTHEALRRCRFRDRSPRAGPRRAEVSVQVNGDGKVVRVVTLTKGGRIWRQVRGHVPAAQLLNPLGDTFGDHRPVIATNPKTGSPGPSGRRTTATASAWSSRRGTASPGPTRCASRGAI